MRHELDMLNLIPNLLDYCVSDFIYSCDEDENDVDDDLDDNYDSTSDGNLLGRVLAEFDGTTVLCRVCGDKASGFHYGVHSCEGCKGFFRRSIQQKIQYRPCTKNQQCAILRINRNRCQYCRLKKCIAVGMSRDAVRFGRVPKREKAKILAAMQSVQNKSQEKALSAELEDAERLVGTIIQAHLDTCDFTKEKIAPLLQRAHDSPVYTSCPPTLACPLNPNPQPVNGQQQLLQDFSERFSPAIRGVVEFAKKIPGFSLLSQDDQVTLLKAGVFEVLLIRLACMFDSHTNTMLCLNGQVLRRESIHHSSNARFLMDSMFDFADRLNSLGLSDAELGLFSSVVVITPDRPGLRNVDLVDKMNRKLSDALGKVLDENHPHDLSLHQELMKKVPDLRTLNTLHSEKLLAFKMTEQQQQQHSIDSLYSQSCNNYWVDDKYDQIACEEEIKSPYSCVSSADSVCSGEMIVDSRHNGIIMNSLPKRKRESSQCEGVSSGDEGDTPRKCPYKVCKVDSPSDSGIESGNEKFDKLSSRSGSVCSSPRSTLDDRVKDIVDTEPVEQPRREVQPSPTSSGQLHSEEMPVLKRALQAPPLINTNLLMSEAYRNIPHKKFRAAYRKDSTDLEVSSREVTPNHSMLAQSLMQGPKLTMEQQKRSDYLHNMIMRDTDISTVSHSSHHSSPYNVMSRSISPSTSWRTVTSSQSSPNTTSRLASPPLPQQSENLNSFYVTQDVSSMCSPFRTSPTILELQLGVNGDSQPLNLSKKTESELKLCLQIKSEN